jgi:lambda family phage portal protein
VPTIDRLISWVSPRWSAQRAAWRQLESAATRAENSYRGGVPTRTSESYPQSTGFRYQSTQERGQLVNARDRAYNAFRNNPVARTLVQTECDNVIGDGLNYQPSTDSKEWNREAKDRYYEWLENASVRGPDIHSGCELQRLLWQRSRIAGDVGWILVARGSDSLIQVVPAENIVTPDGSYSDRSIYDGIRFDSFGRPVSFFVLNYDERGGGRKFEEVGYRDFVYLPHLTDPNQARGESCYTTIFDLLSNLDRYVDGVSLAAWMGAVFGLVFKEQTGAKQLAGLPSLSNSQGAQQKAITLENGMVKYIGNGDDIVQVDAKQPMQNSDAWIRAVYRMLGQPFDMPLEVIAKDMSTVNFASARIGLLPFYRSCRIKADRFGSRWSRTIRWWLSRERQRAQDDPKRWKSAWPENYFDHDLLVNKWDYTDPVNEVQSDQLQIDMGIKSPQMVMAERGRDAETILRERREWADETEDLPQVRSTMTRDPAPDPAEMPPPTPPQPNQADQQESSDA